MRNRLLSGRGLVLVLGLLTLSTPLLLVVLVLSDIPVVLGLLLALPLAAAQIATVAVVAHRRLLHRLPPAEATESLSRDLEVAESAVRRAEERMHALRASVMGITASYRLLRDRHAEIGPGTRARLEKMHEAELERLERLVRPEQGDRKSVESVDLHATITSLVDWWRLKGHRVAWTGTDLHVCGRADDVTDVVQALLENAAAHAPGAPVVVSVGRDGDRVEVRVSDFGPGIAPEIAPTVFERGVRGARSEGQGLGLHMARATARQMDGDLRLDAWGAAHTSFVLTLPIYEEPTCREDWD